LISSHYRSPLNFSVQGLEEAGRGIERIYETLERLSPVAGAGDGRPDEALLGEFCAAMDDDFNTPRAMAVIFEEVRNLNRSADEDKTAALPARVRAIEKMAEVLGLMENEPQAFARRKKDRWLREQGLTAEGIEELVRRRDRARSEKRWDEADRIRAELKQQGILVEDLPQGTIWKVQ
jgi:cysteinyl-tRNA synthetase